MVSAVFEDLPGNSHLNFKFVTVLGGRDFDQWTPRPPDIVGSMGECLRTSACGRAQRHPMVRESSLRSRRSLARQAIGAAFARDLSPIARYSSLSGRGARTRPRGNPRTLQALALVGDFIVLIAVFNFVNLTTARAAHRSVEVGVRKLAGARRRDLIVQFMGESFLLPSPCCWRSAWSSLRSRLSRAA